MNFSDRLFRVSIIDGYVDSALPHIGLMAYSCKLHNFIFNIKIYKRSSSKARYSLLQGYVLHSLWRISELQVDAGSYFSLGFVI